MRALLTQRVWLWLWGFQKHLWHVHEDGIATPMLGDECIATKDHFDPYRIGIQVVGSKQYEKVLHVVLCIHALCNQLLQTDASFMFIMCAYKESRAMGV